MPILVPQTSETDWVYTSGTILNIRSGRSIDKIYDLSYIGSNYPWNSSKNYQFETQVYYFYATSASFSISPNWSDQISFDKLYGTTPSVDPSSSLQSLYLYSSPPTNKDSTTQIKYSANGTFSNTTGIYGFTISEIDFKLQGFSFYKLTGFQLNIEEYNSIGWHYDRPSDTYLWYDRIIGSPSSIIEANEIGMQPVGGIYNSKRADAGYRLNNYISKFIPYSYFNLTFYHNNLTNYPLSIYLSPTLPSDNPATWEELVAGSIPQPTNSILIATITQSATNSIFYGLKGNQYLYFTGGFMGASASNNYVGYTHSSMYISSITIDGGYNIGNNQQYLMTNNSEYSNPTQLIAIGLTSATYSSYVGTGNTINATSSMNVRRIFSKIGNGTYRSGIWENGVWNSGWRVDESMYEFYSIYQFFTYNKTKRWRVEILGPTTSVSNFEIGDNVSIGNIVSININNDRKLLKGYFSIINKTETTIIVEFDSDFPLRSIEKDSEYHRIYISKNVWLSGGFLNGYFTGIWNYGLFKGYPLITEMKNTHWIDGIFDGGHFKSDKYLVPDFTNILYSDGKVGLTFSTPHRLAIGDSIIVSKSNNSINPQYNGSTSIIEIVNDYNFITNIDWLEDSIISQTGSVSIDLSKGLIQNMQFNSNNKSKITSVQSLDSISVFLYDSWIDVNYYETSGVNIGKPQNLTNDLSGKQYSENNLFGYPTNDVLQSYSTFRDSFSNQYRQYKLGSKYKIFADFIGSPGSFENDFYDDDDFFNLGWTYSRVHPYSLTFSRTEDFGVEGLVGEELKVQVIGYDSGFYGSGILDVSSLLESRLYNGLGDDQIEGKTYQEVQKGRYTKIEFDLITFSSDLSFFITPYVLDIDQSYSLQLPNYGYMKVPQIHFNNLNKVKRSVYYSNIGITASTYLDASFLPIYENVDYLATSGTKKCEYFFNKTNMSMTFNGYIEKSRMDTIEYIIDNLHFYEVDMIPFFKYFVENNINKGIQTPYQGISPFIDYNNSNFNFIDNISIGLDSIYSQNSNTPISGVGVGIVNPIINQAFYIEDKPNTSYNSNTRR